MCPVITVTQSTSLPKPPPAKPHLCTEADVVCCCNAPNVSLTGCTHSVLCSTYLPTVEEPIRGKWSINESVVSSISSHASLSRGAFLPPYYWYRRSRKFLILTVRNDLASKLALLFCFGVCIRSLAQEHALVSKVQARKK